MKKVAIIGANSAISKNFYSHFKNDYEFFLVARSFNDVDSKDHTHRLTSDYEDLDRIVNFIENVDTLLYCIGVTNGGNELIKEINIHLFQRIIDKVPRSIPIIFISSIAVELNNDFYAQSKIMGEEFLAQSGLSYTVLRPSVLYGKFDRNNLYKIKQITKSLPILPKFGKSVSVQPLNIKDISLLLNRIIVNNLYKNKAYSISGPDKIMMDQVINLFISQFKLFRIRIFIPIRFIQKAIRFFKYFIPINFGLIRQIENMKPHPPISSNLAINELGFIQSKFNIEEID